MTLRPDRVHASNKTHTMDTITDEQVIAFIEEKRAELASFAPGYTTIRIHSVSGTVSETHFKSYNEHYGHSPDCRTSGEAVEWMRREIKGKTPEEKRHEEIEWLKARVADLEAKEPTHI